jgi:hypothetical protein
MNWAGAGASGRQGVYLYLTGLLGMVFLLAPRMVDVGGFIDSDEAFSVLLAQQDFSIFASGAIADRPHPPLHIFLMYLIAHLHLDTALLGRVLGIAGSAAGFFLLARMALRETKSAAISIAVLLVFALSDFFVYRSMTIRPYSIIIPLGCAQLYFFVSMLHQARDLGRKVPAGAAALRWWLASSVLLMSTQYLSVPVTGTEFLILAAFVERHALLRALAVLAGAATCLAAWYYLGSMSGPSLTATWWATGKPGAREFVYNLLTFFGSAPVSAMWLGMLLTLIYLNALRKWRLLETYELALAAVVLAPLVAVFTLSLLGPLNIFAQRQLIVPALALVVLTCSLTRLLQRGPQWSCLFLIVVWAAASLPMGLPRFSKPPFGQITDALAARGIQKVYSTKWELTGLRYYAGSRFDVTALSEQGGAIVGKFDRTTGFVCRPNKCALIARAIRSSGMRMCGQRIEWNMINYAFSAQVLVFFPAALLRPAEECAGDFLPN